MSSYLYYPLAFLFVVLLLVVVHEFGHYLAARYLGVKVLRFSVGFGKVIWLKRFGKDATEWVFSAIPLGGYVRMLDESEGEVSPAELHRSFSRQALWRRSLIVLAGPLANFLLAILLYWGLFWYGLEQPRPLLAAPVAASPAASAGLLEGDRVVRVAGVEVATWQDFHWEVLRAGAGGRGVELEVINPRNEIASRMLDVSSLAESAWEGDAFAALGLRLMRPRVPAVIGVLTAGGIAAAAGLRTGDEVVSVDGSPVSAWHEVVSAVRESPKRQLVLDVIRDGRQISIPITPAEVDEGGKPVGRIGAGVADFSIDRDKFMVRIAYAPLPALAKAVVETWDKSQFSLRMLGKMLVGEVSWRNVSGPLTIADYAGQSAKRGIETYLRFVALISLSLGVLNLLPVPMLDGGHLLYHVAEFVRRKPLSERAMEFGQQIGLGLLVTLMMLALYNDIYRLVSG